MGCFGDMTPTKQVDSSGTSGPEQWVRDAGQQNYDLAKNVLSGGFKPYTGELTAPLSPDQQAASALVGKTAATGNPYAATSANDFTTVGNAPGFKYNFNSVVDPNSPLGPMSNYMDPYLAAVLAPTLRNISQSGSLQRQGINANATTAGAYGDARHGVVEANQMKNEGQQVADTTAGAYSGAFNTGMGLREQDLQRLFGTQQAQQGADETGLARMRQSGIDLTGLDSSEVARALGLTSALGQTGKTAQDTQNTADTAAMNEFMRSNNFNNNEIAFLTSILAGTPKETLTSGTQTTSQPDNSGFQLLGALGGSLLSAI